MIKKLLFFTLLFILIAVGALAVFLFTFNVDQLRPLIVEKLEEGLGKPVEIERLSLTWADGIALKLNRLALYGDDAKRGRAVVELEEVSVVVKLLPLLRKEIEIRSVRLIRPYFHLIRNSAGQVSIAGLEQPRPKAEPPGPAVTPAGVSSPEAVKASVIPLLVEHFKLEDGKLRFTDQKSEPPLDLEVREADLTVRNVSFDRPVEIQGKAAFLSDRQNLALRGRLRVNQKELSGTLEDVVFETKLSDWQMERLIEAFPKSRKLGIGQNPEGNFKVRIDSLEFNREGVGKFSSQVDLEGGRVVLSSLGAPLEKIELQGLIGEERIEVRNFSMNLAGGTLLAEGTLEKWMAPQPKQLTLRTTVQGVSLETLVPPKRPDEPSLRGRLAAQFQGGARAAQIETLPRALSGGGKVSVSDPVLVNVNVIREVFNRLSVIPSLVERLQNRLPEDYKEKLEAEDTVLKPIEIPFTAQNRTLFIDQFVIASDTFEIQGAGRVGFDGSLNGQAILLIDPDLSNAFIRSIEELRYLANAEGRLQIPLVILGLLPHVQVYPDVQQVAALLAASKTREVVGSFLEKKLLKKEASTSEPQTAPQEKPSLFGELLQQAFQATAEPRQGTQ
jgi:hypothetical protein